MTEKERNDYFYVCALIEYIARETKNCLIATCSAVVENTHFGIKLKSQTISGYWNCSFHQLQSSHQLWMKFSGPQPVLHV